MKGMVRNSEKGFTVVEIIIAIVIFVIFMGGVIALMRGAPRQFEETAKQKAADSNVMVAMQAMVKDLQASFQDTQVSDFKSKEMTFWTYAKAKKKKESDLIYAYKVKWKYYPDKKKLARFYQRMKMKKGGWNKQGKAGKNVIPNIGAFKVKAVKLEDSPPGKNLVRAVGIQIVSSVKVAGTQGKTKSSLAQTTVFLRGTNSVAQQPFWNKNQLYDSAFVKIKGGRFVGIDNPFDYLNDLMKNIKETVNGGIGDFVDDMKAQVTNTFKSNITKYSNKIKGSINTYKDNAIKKYSGFVVKQASKVKKAAEKYPRMVRDGLVSAMLKDGMDFDTSDAKSYGQSLINDLETGGKSILTDSKLKQISREFESAVNPGLSDYFDRARNNIAKDPERGLFAFNSHLSKKLDGYAAAGGKKLRDFFVTQKEFAWLAAGKVGKVAADAGVTIESIKTRVEKYRKFLAEAARVDDEGTKVSLTSGLSNHLEKYFHMITEQGLNDLRRTGAEDAIDTMAKKAEQRFKKVFSSLIDTFDKKLTDGWNPAARKLLRKYEEKLASKLTEHIFGKIGAKAQDIKSSLNVNKWASIGKFDLFGKLQVKGAGKNTIIGDLVHQVLDPKHKGKTYHQRLLEKQGKELPDTEKDWANKQLEGVVNRYFEGKKEDAEGNIAKVGRNFKKDLFANFNIDVETKKLTGKYASKMDQNMKDRDKGKQALTGNLSDFEDY
ncbi:prepilin-type N-terminal cleavage/methylation domain-containing protein [Candidatus Riflebacteria bacterium]